MNKLIKLIKWLFTSDITVIPSDSEFLQSSKSRYETQREAFNNRWAPGGPMIPDEDELTEFEEQLIDLDNYNHKGQ